MNWWLVGLALALLVFAVFFSMANRSVLFPIVAFVAGMLFLMGLPDAEEAPDARG